MLRVLVTMPLSFKSNFLYAIYLTTSSSTRSLSLFKLLGRVFSLATTNLSTEDFKLMESVSFATDDDSLAFVEESDLIQLLHSHQNDQPVAENIDSSFILYLSYQSNY